LCITVLHHKTGYFSKLIVSGDCCCRQKLDEVTRSKEAELAALRQHISAIEQQLADSNIVSCANLVLFCQLVCLQALL